MNNRAIAIIALFAVQLLYGINYTIAKNVINEGFLSSFGLVVFRVGGAAILFWLVSCFIPKEKIDKKDYVTFFLAAIFGVVINMLFFLKGLELTTPISASVITTITPIVILILSSFFLDEKITKTKITGVAFGFIGGILLTLLTTSTRVGDNLPLGNLFMFINVISYSIYITLIKKLSQKYHPFTFIKWLFLFGFFMVLPFGYNDLVATEWGNFTPYATFSVLYVTIAATFGTYFFNPIALRKLKASTVGIFIYLQPVIAGMFALIMGSDSLSPIKIIAMLFIFYGVYLVTKKTKGPLN